MSLPEHILQAVRQQTLDADPFSTQKISRTNTEFLKSSAANAQDNSKGLEQHRRNNNAKLASAAAQQLAINGVARQVGTNRRVLSPAALKKLERIYPENYTISTFTRLDSSAVKKRSPKSKITVRPKHILYLSILAVCVSAILGAIATPDAFNLLQRESNIERTFAQIVASVGSGQRIALSDSGLPAPFVFTPPKNVEQQERLTQTNLIKFISGMIVVFRPNNKDAGEIARHIVEISKEHNLDPLLIASLISSESGFRASARSSVGAMGLMQLRPSTANEVLVKMTSKGNKRKIRKFLNNPEINIRLGIQYLLHLEKRYKGDRYMALAAYNWGPGNVRKARKAGKSLPGSVKHYAESILERTTRWNEHFRNAQIAASKLAVQSPGNLKQPAVMSATLAANQNT